MRTLQSATPAGRFGLLCGMLLAPFVWASPAAAQAWAPPARVGAVSFLVQRIDNTGHRLDDGTEIPDGKSTNVGIAVQFDYAFTERLSVTAQLPYVLSVYRGPGLPPEFLPYLPVDSCRCWNGSFQDVTAMARYSLLERRRPFAITPSIAVTTPSHDYAFQGEAVPGRHLTEVRLGVDAGVRLDRVSPRLSVSGSYAYGVVERVLGIRNDRSLFALDGVFAVSRRLAIRGTLGAQRTHGGFRFPQDVVGFPERIAEHDRLLRDNYTHIGGGASYTWNAAEVFASVTFYAAGINTHMGWVTTAGVSLPFERAAPAPKR